MGIDVIASMSRSVAKNAGGASSISEESRLLLEEEGRARHFLFGPTLSEVGVMSQREALGLVEPVDKSVRRPSSVYGFPNTTCTQMGVNFECSAADAEQRVRTIQRASQKASGF